MLKDEREEIPLNAGVYMNLSERLGNLKGD